MEVTRPKKVNVRPIFKDFSFAGLGLRWEFIKENKKVRKKEENTLSTKKATMKTFKKKESF